MQYSVYYVLFVLDGPNPIQGLVFVSRDTSNWQGSPNKVTRVQERFLGSMRITITENKYIMKKSMY